MIAMTSRAFAYTVIMSVSLILATACTAQQVTSEATGWSYACLTQGLCELKAEIRANNTVAARISVIYIRDRFILQYTIPLGVDFARGVEIAIDEEPRIPTNLISCSVVGCTGDIDLNPDIIQTMKKGSELKILFARASSQDTFAITFSLVGFTAGFSGLVAESAD